MFNQRGKKPQEQGRAAGRQVQRNAGMSPAFSYYASRATDTPRERTQQRQQQQQAEKGKGRGKVNVLPSALSFWLLIILAAVCLMKVLWLSNDPKVIVVDNTDVSAAYLRQTNVYEMAARNLLAGSIVNHSKLTADLDGTAKSLESEFPELQSVALNIPLVSNRPVVYVQVAQPSLILQTTHGNYALNKDGLVLAQLHSVPAEVPAVVDQSGAVPRPGKQYLPSSTVSFAQIVAYQLKAAHISINTFVLPSGSPYELDVRPQGQSYVIRFNLEEDALTQSGATVATLQHLGGATPPNYLDVRVPGRVYYK